MPHPGLPKPYPPRQLLGSKHTHRIQSRTRNGATVVRSPCEDIACRGIEKRDFHLFCVLSLKDLAYL